MTAFDLTDVRCTHCGEARPDQVGLSLPPVEQAGDRDFGFCSEACFVLFVREQYIEAGASPSRVLATPVETPCPPRGRVSTGIGGHPGPGVSREVHEQVQVPPASEDAEATIQRLIAQAAVYGRRVAELEADLRIANEATLVLAGTAAAYERELHGEAIEQLPVRDLALGGWLRGSGRRFLPGQCALHPTGDGCRCTQ